MSDDTSAKAIFGKALETDSPEQRSAYLDAACGDDPQLRSEVDDLLQAIDQAGSFMARPVLEPQATIDQPPITEGPSTVIGPYKLLQQIGEGGFGVVFMADQTEPVKRRVALKIIKPGMDTRQVIARFEAERQALAMMDHPNIAKVLDAGTTESGRPYFVMELVKGIPITQYCDEKQLTPRERLELFVPVCQALQHAHQKGIIHRDIKPSNVLVAKYDDRPVPKVIDFGVVKAIEQHLTEKTMFTQYGQIVGTVEYMSPEQADLNMHDIDTRSDIYSLGVLLYELLSGATPFDRRRLRSAAFDELMRIIREEEPPKPSTRLSTSKSLPSIAANRHIEPKKLSALVHGELDWIVMKALEKDRARRYETANAFANDIRRYLNDEPVKACPPSARYRMSKFARRNKIALATVAIIATSLVLGTTVSVWQATVARRAEALAEARLEAETRARERAEIAEGRATAEAVRSGQVAQFMKDMLKGVAPRVALGRDTLLLREILDETAERLDDQLQQQPSVQADLMATLGKVYSDLGEYSSSAAMHRQALDLRRTLLGGEHPDVAQSLNDLAELHYWDGKWSEAEAVHREALAMRRKLLGGEHLAVAQSLHNLAEALRRQHKFRGVEPLFRESLAIREKLLGHEHLDVAQSLHRLGLLLSYQQEFDEAEPMLREALALRRKLLGSEHPDVAFVIEALGVSAQVEGRYSDAEAMHREALAMRRRLLGDDHPDVAHSLHNLAKALQSQDKPAEAEPLYREALSLRSKLLSKEDPNLRNTFTNLVRTLRDQNKVGELETIYQVRAAMLEERWTNEDLPPDAASLAYELHQLGVGWRGMGKHEEAEAALRQALALRRKVLGDEHLDVAQSLHQLGGLLGDQGVVTDRQKFPEAEQMLREGLAIRRKLLGNEARDVGVSLYRLGWLLHDFGWRLNDQERLAEAEQMHRETLAMRRRLLGDDHPDVAASKVAVKLSVAAALMASPNWEQRAIEIEELLFAAFRVRHPTSKKGRPGIGHWLRIWAFQLPWRGEYLPYAERALRKASDIFESLTVDFPDSTEAVHNFAWLAQTQRCLGEVLERSEQASEAEQEYLQAIRLYDEHLEAFNQQVPFESRQAANCYLQLASLLVRTGRSKESEKFYRKADELLDKIIETSADNSSMHYQHALVQLLQDNAAGFRNRCAAMLEQFANTEDKVAAHWLAWTCCLAPAAVDDLSIPLSHAASLAENDQQNAQHLVALGAVLYRGNQYDEAARRLEQAIAAFASDKSGVSAVLYPRLFLVMTKWQQDQQDEARQLFEEMQADIDEALASPSTAWNRRATLELLRSEAEALFAQDEASGGREPENITEE